MEESTVVDAMIELAITAGIVLGTMAIIALIIFNH